MFDLFSDTETVGDKLFEQQRYTLALDEYSKGLFIGIGQENLKLKMADCYRLLGDYENTVDMLGQVLDRGADVEPEYFLYYADALSAVGKHQEAVNWYQLYSLSSEDMRGNHKIDGINYLQQFHKNEDKVKVSEVNFNTLFAEFSPAFFKEDLYFISDRPSNKGISPTNFRDGNHYFDVFKYSEGTGQTKPVSKAINSILHEGSLAITGDESEIIFTRSSNSKSTNGETKLQLFSSLWNAKKEKWENALPLSLNNKEYSVGHPTLTESGTTLYFISDMPGGFGGTDIYKVERRDDIWGEPQNLGYEINTEGNEMFPFLARDGKLYFASNGHAGLGGLDIFMVDLNNSQMKVINLGAPINSIKDDFGFVMDSTGKKIYFSSNRGEEGDDDIFKVKGWDELRVR